MEAKRLLPLSGLGFVALIALTAALGGSSPRPDASGRAVLAFYDGDELRHFILSFVLAASVPFLIVFAAAVSSGEGARPVLWERVLMAGAVLTGAIALIVAMLHLSLVEGADNGVSATAVQTVNLLEGNTWVAYSAAFGVMMIGAAGSLLGRAGIHGWLGRVAITLGIALFFPVADFVALLLTAVWIVVTSVALFRESSRAPHAAAPVRGVAA